MIENGSDFMQETVRLTGNILLSEHRAYGKNCRIHEDTRYVHSRREVIYRYSSVKLRFWKRLPPKVRKEESALKIPPEIVTEAQLRKYVTSRKRCWLR